MAALRTNQEIAAFYLSSMGGKGGRKFYESMDKTRMAAIVKQLLESVHVTAETKEKLKKLPL